MKISDSNLFLLILLSILNLIITKVGVDLLNVNELIYENMMNELTLNQLEKINSVQKMVNYLNYLITPIAFLIKTILISFVLLVGLFFYNYGEAKFKLIWRILLKAEFIFLLMPIFKTAWFYFFQPNYTLQDLQYFYPLSAINIVGYEGLDPWWVYPFQVLNLFEVVYWLILAYLLGKAINVNTNKGLSIVASSYGVSLLIWVVGVMFFTLNMS